MQIILPDTILQDEIPSLLEKKKIIRGWSSDYPDHKKVLHLLMPAEECESVMDKFERRFSETDGYSIVLLPVEAFLPRPKSENNVMGNENEKLAKETTQRVSRAELYADINEGIKISPSFLAMTILSAIVAAIGLIRNDLAVIIGAMVIAPLLTPNMALALSTTLGDIDLLRNSLKTNITGCLTATVLSIIIGLIFEIDPATPAVASRTTLGISDIVLALASGCAGTFAFTSGVSGALIGVMVAVALMPPLVTFGMLLGAGYLLLAYKALLLVIANVICVNLAGVGTFFFQGVRPGTWWEAEKAKKSARIAALLWGTLLIVLMAVILLENAF
jgi:uncharacterized hydrophobic protein (TIGR00341 family)